MKLQDIAIGVILFSMIFIAMGLFMSDLNTNYGDITNFTINETYSATYDKMSKIENDSSLLSANIQNATIKETLSYEPLATAGYTALKLSFGSLGYVTSILNAVAIDIGIPFWAIAGTISIITVLIGFTILGYIFRWRG